MTNDLEQRVRENLANPKNMGEMKDADSVGTAGSPDCGDMMRLWLKFKERDGQKIIEDASFQGFGCETAIAVASVATEMLKGKPVSEASLMKGTELAAPLGPLPPMKIHCASLVEEALRYALQPSAPKAPKPQVQAPTLSSTMTEAQAGGMKIVFKGK